MAQAARPAFPRLFSAPPDLTDFQPRKAKGAWADAPWRHRHPFCSGQFHPPLEPIGDLPKRAQWVETCGFVPPPVEVTILGSGFSAPPGRNSVFFGGVKAEVVSGDEGRLVVRPRGGAPLSSIAVRTSGAIADDLNAADRAFLAPPMRFIGPPHALVVVEGDHQSQIIGSPLARIVVRLTDISGEGVPQERVWFWLRRPAPHGPATAPVMAETLTDGLGLATALVTLPDEPGPVTIAAEAVNVSQDPDKEPNVRISAMALPRPADVDRLVQELGSGNAESRSRAAGALSDMGALAKDASPSVKRLASSSDSNLHSIALDVLAHLDPDEALPLLIADLQSGSAPRPMMAAATLARMGPAAAPAASALARVLATRGPGDYGPRVEALAALKSLGRAAAPATPAVIEALSDRDAWIASTAAETLGHIRPPESKAVEPSLRKALEDARPDVRRAAKAALEALGASSLGQLQMFAGNRARVAVGGIATIKARLVDEEGRPKAHEPVVFSLAQGTAAIPRGPVLTDYGGVATANVTMGTAGRVVIEARYGASVATFELLPRVD